MLLLVATCKSQIENELKKRIYLQLQKWYQILIISLYWISGTDSKTQKALK